MNQFLAIAVYRCEVAGSPTDSIDVQVRYFPHGDSEEILNFLATEELHSYANGDGELVSWPFVSLVAVSEVENPTVGQEVSGFITGTDQFIKWASNVL